MGDSDRIRHRSVDAVPNVCFVCTAVTDDHSQIAPNLCAGLDVVIQPDYVKICSANCYCILMPLLPDFADAVDVDLTEDERGQAAGPAARGRATHERMQAPAACAARGRARQAAHGQAARGQVRGQATRGKATGQATRGKATGQAARVARGRVAATELGRTERGRAGQGHGQAARARRLRKPYHSSDSDGSEDFDHSTAPLTSTRRRGAIVLEDSDSDEGRVQHKKKAKQSLSEDSVASRTRAGGRRDSACQKSDS